MPNQSIDMHELLQYVLLEIQATWRYRWRALILAWCVLVVGALLVFSLPNRYEADAQVYADTDALTNPLLHGLAVQPDMRGRLQLITQTMLSRPNLEKVADQTGLSLRATTPADKDALLVKLGKDVTVKNAGAKDLYDISYSDPDPKTAQKVVQAFLQILMNDSLGANSASTQSAQTFLQRQVTDYNDRLNDAEKKLAEFKKANIGYLPGPGGGDYSARLQAAETKLQELQGQYAAAPTGRGSVTRQASPQIREIDQQLALSQQKLDRLLLSYTDQYPDVISTRRMIAQLKARRAEALKHPGSESAVVISGSHSDGQVSASAISAEITSQKQQIADLRKNADKITDAQVKLSQLSRNYDITKKQYDVLAARLNTARMSEDATQTGNNLKFRVISPPIAPPAPASPHRSLLLLAVFLIALGIGVAFAYFLHKIKPVFTTLKSLREFGGYPVIGSFSLIESATRREEKRREVIGFCTGVGLLALVLVVGVAFSGPLANLMQHVFVMGAT
ncbi:MAG TPA: XrtA system polysaccharide chain length determinant [Rhodanobacter sp.]|jgi:polysaccharide chain length determinant protein (PEP-CTERM system associated)|nr:XrtA system polysaccharide chain length determinant [Rhodanobacter sp.]